MKIGIDLGVSHIGIGVVENGNIIEKIETDMISKTNQNDMDVEKEKIENYILKNIEKLLKKYTIEEIGIAVPGTTNNGKISSLVNLGIREWNLQKVIRK